MREFSYMIAATLFAIGLISYFLYLVSVISGKGQVVFGSETLQGTDNESFNFKHYDEVIMKLYPGSTTVLSAYAPMPGDAPRVTSSTSADPKNASTTSAAQPAGFAATTTAATGTKR